MFQAMMKRNLLWLYLVLAATLFSAVQIYKFAQTAAEREIQAWQTQLGAEAYAQAQLFEDWVSQLEQQVETLAQNNALRLYLSTRGEEQDAQILAGQQDYLRNLLTITAENLGLNVTSRSEVKADISGQGQDGLALITPDGQIIAGLGTIRNEDLSPPKLHSAENNRRVLTTQAIVYGIQNGDTPVGKVVLNRDFDEQALRFLEPQFTRPIPRQHILAQRAAGQLLTILGGRPGLLYQVKADNPFAELHIGPDNRHIGVAAPIRSLGRELLVSVSEKQILTPIYERRNLMMTTLGLTLLLLLIAVLFAWRHSASRQVEQALKKEEALRRLFKLVADKQPTAVLIIGKKGQILFANAIAAQLGKTDPAEMSGKTLSAVFGAAASRPFNQILQMVNENQDWADISTSMDFGAGTRLGRLLGAPLSQDEMGEEATVLIWDDLTDVLEAQKRKEKSLEDLTTVLTGLIDARDPYSAAQGAHIAALSKPMAEALDYDGETQDILALASKLLNLGKVLVPREILTKAGDLSAEELQQVQKARAKTTELLKHIQFDTPVLDIIQDATGLENNVSGPAAVLRMMNDFISMVSPRAHRDALDIDTAIAALKDREGFYDKASIAALIYVLEHKKGRDIVTQWQAIERSPLPAL